jgi:RNA polymerase sigma-70 factor (ECF subfamily)
VERTKPKDVKAFTALFKRHYPRVSAFALRRTGDRAAAEDIAAEVFRIAWEQTEVVEPAWLFVTARNLLRNHYRAQARLGETVQRLRAQRPEADEPGGRIDALLAALEQLPEDQRELLLAHYWDGLSAAECGTLLGGSPGAIWVRLHRARAALRQLMDKERKES